jgi:hypothetical protein
MVIVDYADLVKTIDLHQQKRGMNLENIYEELRGIAQN